MLNSCVPKSTMGAVHPLKPPSSDLMAWSENFRFNYNYVDKYLPRIIFYIPLAKSSMWHLHITTFFALSSGKVNYTSTLRLVIILSACVCHFITAPFLVCSFLTRIPITIVEVHPLFNRIRKFLNFALPFLAFIHPCRIG